MQAGRKVLERKKKGQRSRASRNTKRRRSVSAQQKPEAERSDWKGRAHESARNVCKRDMATLAGLEVTSRSREGKSTKGKGPANPLQRARNLQQKYL